MHTERLQRESFENEPNFSYVDFAATQEIQPGKVSLKVQTNGVHGFIPLMGPQDDEDAYYQDQHAGGPGGPGGPAVPVVPAVLAALVALVVPAAPAALGSPLAIPAPRPIPSMKTVCWNATTWWSPADGSPGRTLPKPSVASPR